MTLKMRKLKGCWDISEKPRVEVDDIKYKTCPGNYYDGSVVSLIEMFSRFENGIMPFEGGYGDQPAKLINAFNLIDAIRRQKQTEADDKAKREAKKGGGRGRR